MEEASLVSEAAALERATLAAEVKRFGRWLESDAARLVLLAVAALGVGLAVGLWTASILSR